MKALPFARSLCDSRLLGSIPRLAPPTLARRFQRLLPILDNKHPHSDQLGGFEPPAPSRSDKACPQQQLLRVRK